MIKYFKKNPHILKAINILEINYRAGSDILFGINKFKELFINIQKEGIKYPIICVLDINKDFKIRFGNRRVIIARLLRIKEVPVLLYYNKKEKGILPIDNIKGRTVTKEELCMFFENDKNIPGLKYLLEIFNDSIC